MSSIQRTFQMVPSCTKHSSVFVHKKHMHKLFFPMILYLVSMSVPVKSGQYIDFNYDPTSPHGPQRWSKVDTDENEWQKWVGKRIIDLDVPNNECKSTRRPSPVIMEPNIRCRDDHEILTRRIRNSDCKLDSMTFDITRHFLRAEFPENDKKCQRPTIDLPFGYPDWWVLQHLEMHIRAEHVVDGRRYDGEINMMHLGTQDQMRETSNISILLDASGDKDDPRLQLLINKWKKKASQMKSSCNRRGGNERTNGHSDNLFEDEDLFGYNENNEIWMEYNDTNDFEGDWLEDDTSGVEGDWFEGNNTDNEDNEEPEQPQVNMLRSSIRTEPEQPRVNMLRSSSAANSTNIFRAIDDPEHRNGANRRGLGFRETYIPRKRMFPYDFWPTIYFYGYKGSITSPPCSEIVSWRVMDEAMKISKKQLKQLAQLQNSHVDPKTCRRNVETSPTGENIRYLQKLNNKEQEMKHCTSKNFGYWLYPRDEA